MTRRPALLLPVLLAAGCFGPPRNDDSYPDVVPVDVAAVADAVPRAEPKSRYGNPPSYEVEGRRYHVMASAAGYRERGHASFYGQKFHGRRTSSGEPYDMFAMTAAHKTLPLPSYVRVTNLRNGRSVVVRVNDRGPFRRERIIDLSYTAAAKLGFVEQGSTEVEVVALDPAAPEDAAAVAAARPNFLEVGTYRDPIEAVAVKEEVAALGLDAVQIHSMEYADGVRHRVVVGPFADATSYATAKRLLDGRADRPKPGAMHE